MPVVVERLEQAGLLVESEGAEVVFPPGFTNREGEPLPLIIRSSAGGFPYATSDLACVLDPSSGSTPTCCCTSSTPVRASTSRWSSRSTRWQVAEQGDRHGPCTVRRRPRHGPRRLRRRSGDSVKLIELLTKQLNERPRRSPRRTPISTTQRARHGGTMIGMGGLKFADLSNGSVKDYVLTGIGPRSRATPRHTWNTHRPGSARSSARRSRTQAPSIGDDRLGTAQERRSRGVCWRCRGASTTRSAASRRTSSQLPVRPQSGLHRLLRALSRCYASTSRCAPAGWRSPTWSPAPSPTAWGCSASKRRPDVTTSTFVSWARSPPTVADTADVGPTGG